MNNCATSACNNSQTNDVEIIILFWTLVVAVLAILATFFISYIERRQNAKLNSINLLNQSLEGPFRDYLIVDFCEKIKACDYKIVTSAKTKSRMATYELKALSEVQIAITNFLGNIAYLQYAVPKKYARLNKLGDDINKYIEEEMIPYALYIKYPKRNAQPQGKVIVEQKAIRISDIFIKKIKLFYKETFKLYKYGL